MRRKWLVAGVRPGPRRRYIREHEFQKNAVKGIDKSMTIRHEHHKNQGHWMAIMDFIDAQ